MFSDIFASGRLGGTFQSGVGGGVNPSPGIGDLNDFIFYHSKPPGPEGWWDYFICVLSWIDGCMYELLDG